MFIIQRFAIRFVPVTSKPLMFGSTLTRFCSVVIADGLKFGYQAVTASQRAPSTEHVGV